MNPYEESQTHIVEANRLLRAEDVQSARFHFRKAADLQWSFVKALPGDRVRTIAVYGLSAATLYYRAHALDEAEGIIHRLLSRESIEEHSQWGLRDLLARIRNEHMIVAHLRRRIGVRRGPYLVCELKTRSNNLSAASKAVVQMRGSGAGVLGALRPISKTEEGRNEDSMNSYKPSAGNGEVPVADRVASMQECYTCRYRYLETTKRYAAQDECYVYNSVLYVQLSSFLRPRTMKLTLGQETFAVACCRAWKPVAVDEEIEERAAQAAGGRV